MVLTIHAPETSKILVKAGQKVDFGEPFYEFATQIDSIIPLSKKLGVNPEKIFHFLKKFVGEEIKKGEVLAIKKTLFSSHKVFSDSDGKIKEINHTNGSVIISTFGNDSNTVKSYFKGEITEIKSHEIHLKVKEGKAYPLKKTDNDFGGTVFLADDPQTIMLLSESLSNKIYVSETVSSYIQSKVEALGITGYVTLQKLADDTIYPWVQLKMIDDLKDIMKKEFVYCLVDSRTSMIYFYK